eukprot:CAMPEP_0170542640 /NCGR_PEP_ID=MMETSP0211-20121228/2013_1 /TAXON_ID=311385 /ORGANISM="Pseudokeronopsis sp., Strain OXSARD2" /LENGTH=79 /DNA_ID=CAMNT_0010845785 /DNA_START=705 /DNA_END=944 /DNA_ORIENTATION=-
MLANNQIVQTSNKGSSFNDDEEECKHRYKEFDDDDSCIEEEFNDDSYDDEYEDELKDQEDVKMELLDKLKKEKKEMEMI